MFKTISISTFIRNTKDREFNSGTFMSHFFFFQTWIYDIRLDLNDYRDFHRLNAERFIAFCYSEERKKLLLFGCSLSKEYFMKTLNFLCWNWREKAYIYDNMTNSHVFAFFLQYSSLVENIHCQPFFQVRVPVPVNSRHKLEF